MKILAELGRTPLKINIGIQTFKYFQRFAFIEKERFSRRKSDGWVKYMKSKLEFLGLGNLVGNIYKVIKGEIYI